MTTNLTFAGPALLVCLALAGCASPKPGRAAARTAAGPSLGEAQAFKPIHHFWFDYNGEPNPGKRVWVQVDETTWVELYPNGLQSRYKAKDRATVGQGFTGVVVEKVGGDPKQTWTLNDGSFQVFLPDLGNPQLILAFRHLENGQWTPWQPLAFLVPIR